MSNFLFIIESSKAKEAKEQLKTFSFHLTQNKSVCPPHTKTVLKSKSKSPVLMQRHSK
jgi:hypothetical protein